MVHFLIFQPTSTSPDLSVVVLFIFYSALLIGIFLFAILSLDVILNAPQFYLKK